MLKVMRWLQCDFPGCLALYEPGHYKDWLERQKEWTHKDLRDGAAAAGWVRTEEGEDLCKRHGDQRKGREDQPALFTMPDEGGGV